QQTCPNPKRTRIPTDHLSKSRDHFKASFPPFFFVKTDRKMVKVISHDRITGWNCPVVHFFLPYDNVALILFRVIKKNILLFPKLIHHKPGQLSCFLKPFSIASYFLQMDEGLDQKCIIIQETGVFRPIVFPGMVKFIRLTRSKLLKHELHVVNRQIPVLNNPCCHESLAARSVHEGIPAQDDLVIEERTNPFLPSFQKFFIPLFHYSF